MSFSVQAPLNERSTLEWSGSSINTVFAQRKNLFNSNFLRMLKDILRFNKLTTELANSGDSERLGVELKIFLENNHFNSYFIDWYLLPMLGCIWSCPPDQMLSFPVSTMIRFCHNHGLLQISNRPRWFTVAGGAKQYVQKITNGIERKFLNTPVISVERTQGKIVLTTPGGVEEFDHVVFATHADQALKIIKDPSDNEHSILSAFKFKDNTAVLHTDPEVLPRSRLAWAAWNFESQSRHGELDIKNKPLAHHSKDKPSVCLHYYLNLLQPLPFSEPVVVSLNPLRPINPSKIQAQFEYTHPIFDLETDKAQHLMPSIQGQNNTWFAGAWMGYGFHEDGHKAGSQAAHALISQLRLA
jgi:predicted NAD/FAD-binding protein